MIGALSDTTAASQITRFRHGKAQHWSSWHTGSEARLRSVVSVAHVDLLILPRHSIRIEWNAPFIPGEAYSPGSGLQLMRTQDPAKNSKKTKLMCPDCHQEELERIARRGFLRKHVYPILGYYPWKCAICGRDYAIRERGAGYGRVSHAKDRPPSPDDSMTLR
jgi:hypothetical protein